MKLEERANRNSAWRLLLVPASWPRATSRLACRTAMARCAEVLPCWGCGTISPAWRCMRQGGDRTSRPPGRTGGSLHAAEDRASISVPPSTASFVAQARRGILLWEGSTLAKPHGLPRAPWSHGRKRGKELPHHTFRRRSISRWICRWSQAVAQPLAGHPTTSSSRQSLLSS